MIELVDRHAVLAALSRHIGADRGVTGHDLAREIAGVFVDGGTERHLRKVIESLRRQGYHVCGMPKAGYFMAANEGDLIETCEFLYARSMTSLEQVSAMRNVSLPDLRGQLRLPT
jgi:hypothetical protein